MQTEQPRERTYLPLVFLPGASGRSAVWQPIAQRLASRRQPVLVDYPTMAEVSSHYSTRGLPGLAELLLPTLPKRFDAAALSMGGALALHLVLKHPERVRRLILVTTAGGINVQALGALDFRPSFVERRHGERNWFVEDASDFGPRLGEIEQPCLLVFGDRDPIAPLAVGQFLKTGLRQARLEILPGATHDLEQEFPDQLASLIEAHLRGT
ncbi:MAG TPA: alpha/beta hydrolase [Polyangiaceae bacterium]|nr:alpha/beta hydrolase [Polyangiaceae bacterium]